MMIQIVTRRGAKERLKNLIDRPECYFGYQYEITRVANLIPSVKPSQGRASKPPVGPIFYKEHN